MIVVNNGAANITLVLNGRIVAVKHTQACEVTEKEYQALKNIFPCLEPVKEEIPAGSIVEPEVKPVKRKKKQK